MQGEGIPADVLLKSLKHWPLTKKYQHWPQCKRYDNRKSTKGIKDYFYTTALALRVNTALEAWLVIAAL